MNAYRKLMSLTAKKEILQKKLLDAQELVERKKLEATGLSGKPITDMPHAPSGEQDKLGAAVIDYVELEDNMDLSWVNEYNQLTQDIMDLIDQTVYDYVKHTILMLHYVAGASLEDIAGIMEYPLHSIERWYNNTLDDLQKKEVF